MFEKKYLSPINNYAFHKIFGEEGSKECLIGFLNSIISEKEEIEDITYLNSEIMPEQEVGKKGIIDVLCKDKNGDKFIIEMQIGANENMIKRLLFYFARIYTSELLSGNDYKNLKKVTVICILNYIMFEKHDKFISKYELIDKDNGGKIEEVKIIFIELKKFAKISNEINTKSDIWLFFLKNAQNMEKAPGKMLEIQGVSKAFDIIDKVKWTRGDMFKYQDKKQAEYEKKEEIKYYLNKERSKAKKERQLAIRESLIMGGHKKETQIARNLKKLGSDVNFISKATGLKPEEIEKL